MSTAADPRERISSLGVTIRELQAQQEDFVNALIDDLKFQEIPFRVLKDVETRIERVHFVTTTHEDNDKAGTSYHPADQCPGMWCNPSFPAHRLKYGRKGRGTWQTFLGTWEVVASYRYSVDMYTGIRLANLVCIPEGALQSPRQRVA